MTSQMPERSRKRPPWRSRTGIAFLSLAMLAAGCGSDDGDTGSSPTSAPSEDLTGEELVIGIIKDTSGSSAAYSTVSQEGILLAVDEINQGEGIDGRPVRLVEESDGSDATQTPALVRRVVEGGAEAVIFTTGSASASGVKALCVELEVVCIHPTTPSPALASPPDNDNFFSMAPGTGDQIDVLGQAFIEAGIKRLAMIHDDSPTIQPIQESLRKGFEAIDVEIVAEEEVPLNGTDMSAAVERVKSANPDAVMVSSLDGRTEIAVYNALAQQLPGVQAFGRQATPNQPDSWANANPGALEGVVFSQTIDPSNPRTERLEQSLQERLGSKYQAMSDYYAQAYDSVYLLKEAFELAADGASLVESMESISGYEPHYGREGFTLSFGPDDHIAPDSTCGIVLLEFGADNRPAGPWDVYQASC